VNFMRSLLSTQRGTRMGSGRGWPSAISFISWGKKGEENASHPALSTLTKTQELRLHLEEEEQDYEDFPFFPSLLVREGKGKKKEVEAVFCFAEPS